MLVPYSGSYDPAYPARLADRIVELVPRQAELRAGAGTRAIAVDRYEYRALGERLSGFLQALPQ
jgi:hypothetical protein